jgi:hypothetical protein
MVSRSTRLLTRAVPIACAGCVLLEVAESMTHPLAYARGSVYVDSIIYAKRRTQILQDSQPS